MKKMKYSHADAAKERENIKEISTLRCCRGRRKCRELEVKKIFAAKAEMPGVRTRMSLGQNPEKRWTRLIVLTQFG